MKKMIVFLMCLLLFTNIAFASGLYVAPRLTLQLHLGEVDVQPQPQMQQQPQVQQPGEINNGGTFWQRLAIPAFLVAFGWVLFDN